MSTANARVGSGNGFVLVAAVYSDGVDDPHRAASRFRRNGRAMAAGYSQKTTWNTSNSNCPIGVHLCGATVAIPCVSRHDPFLQEARVERTSRAGGNPRGLKTAKLANCASSLPI